MDQIFETQLLAGCRRLVNKGCLNGSADSFSMRIPNTGEMILASGYEDWQNLSSADVHTVSLSSQEGIGRLHASIYDQRNDVGAVVVSSPQGVRVLARQGWRLPPVFDELVRHIGPSTAPLADPEHLDRKMLAEALRHGANAALLGEGLLCLGMTCDRVLFNTELFEKCSRAYVLAKASGGRVGSIPMWVRFIATRRLLRDERRAAESYRNGTTPSGLDAY